MPCCLVTRSRGCTHPTLVLPAEELEHAQILLSAAWNLTIWLKSDHRNPRSCRGFVTQILQDLTFHFCPRGQYGFHDHDTGSSGHRNKELRPGAVCARGDDANTQAAFLKRRVKKLSVNWEGHIEEIDHLTPE